MAIQNHSSDKPDYNINFLTGIYCLWKSNYKQARDYFLTAVCETNHLDSHYSLYQSYVGLSGTLMDHKDGAIHHCVHSSNTFLTIEPEVQHNLACSEFIKGDRKRAIQAMNKFEGFVPTRNSKEIRSLFSIVGKRKKNSKGIPKRNHIVYKGMGKLFRQKETVDTGRIEAFVRTTAKNRYKGAMLNINNQTL